MKRTIDGEEREMKYARISGRASAQHYAVFDNGKWRLLCGQWMHYAEMEYSEQSFYTVEQSTCQRCKEAAGEIKRLILFVKPETHRAFAHDWLRLEIAAVFLASMSNGMSDQDWNEIERFYLGVPLRNNQEAA